MSNNVQDYVIEKLEELLALAREGEITGFLIVADGPRFAVGVGEAVGAYEVSKLLFGVESWKHIMLQESAQDSIK